MSFYHLTQVTSTNTICSIAFSSYYVINKIISPQTVSLIDEAVYPRQLGDPETPSSLDGEDVEDLKDHAITKEKEIV
jgi:hypothetical protein